MYIYMYRHRFVYLYIYILTARAALLAGGENGRSCTRPKRRPCPATGPSSQSCTESWSSRPSAPTAWSPSHSFLTQCIFLVSSGKSTRPQERQLNILSSNSKQKVDNFVGGIDFLKQVNEYVR